MGDLHQLVPVQKKLWFLNFLDYNRTHLCNFFSMISYFTHIYWGTKHYCQKGKMYTLFVWLNMKFVPFEAWFSKSTKLNFAKWK